MYVVFVREERVYTNILVMYCCITGHCKVQQLQTTIIIPYLQSFYAWLGLEVSDSGSLMRFQTHVPQVCGHPKVQLGLASPSVPLFANLHVFTKLQAPQTLSFWVSMETSLHRHD